jgi:hypothetical protein
MKDAVKQSGNEAPMSKKDDKPIIRRTLEAHQELRNQWVKIEKQAAQVRATREELGRSAEVLLKNLNQLIPDMETYFHMEESEGLHKEIIEASPHNSHKVKLLLSQHAELLRALGELQGITGSLAELSQCSQTGLYDRLTQLFRTFREHEAKERTLFLEALEGEGPGLA